MYTADLVNGKWVVLKDGVPFSRKFHYLCEAQEHADELNGADNA